MNTYSKKEAVMTSYTTAERDCDRAIAAARWDIHTRNQTALAAQRTAKVRVRR